MLQIKPDNTILDVGSTLFPDADILSEHFMGLTKLLIAVKA